MAGPPPPKGAPEAPKQAAAPKPKPKPKKELAVPQEQPIQVAEAQPVEPEEDVQEGAEVTEDGSTLPPGVANGVEGGDPNSLGVGGGGMGDAVPFGEGMTPPVRLSGPDPQYTAAALEARVEGTMSVRCVVTIDGRVEKCRSIKPLPHMEQPVIQALQSRRYKPAMYQGRAIAVDYVFTIKLVMPKF
jgi:protein TonB